MRSLRHEPMHPYLTKVGKKVRGWRYSSCRLSTGGFPRYTTFRHSWKCVGRFCIGVANDVHLGGEQLPVIGCQVEESYEFFDGYKTLQLVTFSFDSQTLSSSLAFSQVFSARHYQSCPTTTTPLQPAASFHQVSLTHTYDTNKISGPS